MDSTFLPPIDRRVAPASAGPFGSTVRRRVLHAYFETAGPVTTDNAWEHVYRCLLWMNRGAGLAHIYDSNHMQAGGNFHSRAKRFTELLCARWGIQRADLPGRIDFLFKGCVEELRKRPRAEIDEEVESELRAAIADLLAEKGLAADVAAETARSIESLAEETFTIGNKRKNALGEGFEDLLYILFRRVSGVPADQLALRKPVSMLPGFRRFPAPIKGVKAERQPHPDLAVVDANITHVVATAKWSMRQDRETQFAAEYASYQRNRTQETELRFALLTNEFDVARLDNVARAMPGGAGGYIFHTIVHINPELLVATHGDRIGAVRHWVGARKIVSLADYLVEMQGRFGAGG